MRKILFTRNCLKCQKVMDITSKNKKRKYCSTTCHYLSAPKASLETRLKMANTRKGHKVSPETRAKISQTQTRNGNNRGRTAWNVGKNGPGDRAIHLWVEVRLGKAKERICPCGSNINMNWSNISYLYLKDITDWEALCQKCHIRKDMKLNWGAKKRIFDKKGHRL